MAISSRSAGTCTAAILGAVAIIASISVVSLMLILVSARYLLGMSVVGLHELILLFTVQLYMVGALIAAQRRSQLTVDWLAQKIAGNKVDEWHEALISAITLTATIFFVVWAYRMMAWGMERPQLTPALGLPLWISQVPIFISAIGCSAFALRDLLRSVLKLWKRQ